MGVRWTTDASGTNPAPADDRSSYCGPEVSATTSGHHDIADGGAGSVVLGTGGVADRSGTDDTGKRGAERCTTPGNGASVGPPTSASRPTPGAEPRVSAWSASGRTNGRVSPEVAGPPSSGLGADVDRSDERRITDESDARGAKIDCVSARGAGLGASDAMAPRTGSGRTADRPRSDPPTAVGVIGDGDRWSGTTEGDERLGSGAGAPEIGRPDPSGLLPICDGTDAEPSSRCIAVVDAAVGRATDPSVGTTDPSVGRTDPSIGTTACCAADGESSCCVVATRSVSRWPEAAIGSVVAADAAGSGDDPVGCELGTADGAGHTASGSC